MILQRGEGLLNMVERKCRHIRPNENNLSVSLREQCLKSLVHARTEVGADLIEQFNALPFLHNLEEDMRRRRGAGQIPIDWQLQRRNSSFCSLQGIEDEAPMECSGFIRSQRRAEACFDLAGNRRFGKNH